MQITEIKTTAHKRGRTAGKRELTAAWYIFLTVAGAVLYKAGAAYALRWRGYYAVGGEALIPLLLILCSGITDMVRKIVRECSGG